MHGTSDLIRDVGDKDGYWAQKEEVLMDMLSRYATGLPAGIYRRSNVVYDAGSNDSGFNGIRRQDECAKLRDAVTYQGRMNTTDELDQICLVNKGGNEKNEDVLCGDMVKVNQMNKVHIDLNDCSEEMDYDLPDVAPVKGEDTTDHANMRVWESFAGGTFGGIVSRVVDSLDHHEGNVLDVLKGSVAPSVEQKIKEEMDVESNGNRYSNDLDAEIRVDLNGHRMDGDATVASSKEYEVRPKKGARNDMDSIVAVMVECDNTALGLNGHRIDGDVTVASSKEYEAVFGAIKHVELGGDLGLPLYALSEGYLEAEIRVDLNGHRMDGDATVASSKEYEVRPKKGARNDMDSIVAVMVECDNTALGLNGHRIDGDVTVASSKEYEAVFGAIKHVEEEDIVRYPSYQEINVFAVALYVLILSSIVLSLMLAAGVILWWWSKSGGLWPNATHSISYKDSKKKYAVYALEEFGESMDSGFMLQRGFRGIVMLLMILVVLYLACLFAWTETEYGGHYADLMIVFDTKSVVYQSMQYVEEMDLDALKAMILRVHASGGTNFECGYKSANDLNMNGSGKQNEEKKNKQI
eukprot:728551_1